MHNGALKLQLAVFALVSAAFTCIYITQPVLPVIQEELGVTPVQVSMTVSAVILGIVLSNLLFGYLSDRYPIHPILLVGGICVAGGGFGAALAHDFGLLVGARFFQGLFLPALTTSLAAWLARTLPAERLSVVMGAYVSATVLGGLGGRLLGGWIHPPLHWRYALVSASIFVMATALLAVILLPRSRGTIKARTGTQIGFLDLLKRRDLLAIYCCGAGGLLMFTPIFNFLPYRLSSEPFNFSTELITLVYLVYALGIFLGPLAGKTANRFGGGNTLLAGTCILGVSLLLLLVPSIVIVVAGLLGVCTGFFTLHAVAVGLLNQKLSGNHGKANALYVLFYYAGGWLGLTMAGFMFEWAAWPGVVGLVLCFLIVPITVGLIERKSA